MKRYIDADLLINAINDADIITDTAKFIREFPSADEEKIAKEYCMKKGLVMISMDYWEKVIAYENRGTIL